MLIKFVILSLILIMAVAAMTAWYMWMFLYVRVPEKRVAFIERKGKHRLTLAEGRHFISPRDKVKKFCLDGSTVQTFLSTAKEQMPTVQVEVVASDGVIMTVSVDAEYKVTNPVTVVYKDIYAPDYAARIITKAVKNVMRRKDSETIETYLTDFMEAAANAASGMALRYGFRITMSQMRIEGNDVPADEYGLEDEEDYREIPDIEEGNGLPEAASDYQPERIEENPMPEEEDGLIDLSPKEHVFVHHMKGIAEFNDERHIQNFLNYLFRSDKKQKNTNDNSVHNLYAIRQMDGTFAIYRHRDQKDLPDRVKLQREALALLENFPYYNIINDEVEVNLFADEIQYLRDYEQLTTLNPGQEETIFRMLMAQYETEYAPIVICAMHNDQDYGGKRILNHIHRVIVKSIPYERGGIPEED